MWCDYFIIIMQEKTGKPSHLFIHFEISKSQNIIWWLQILASGYRPSRLVNYEPCPLFFYYWLYPKISKKQTPGFYILKRPGLLLANHRNELKVEKLWTHVFNSHLLSSTDENSELDDVYQCSDFLEIKISEIKSNFLLSKA